MIEQFISHCMFEVLIQLTRIDYVGSAERCDSLSVSSITEQIRRLKLSDPEENSTGISTPEELFQSFLAFTPQLPDNPASWGLTLAYQFHSALTEECRTNIETTSKYRLPDAATLLT